MYLVMPVFETLLAIVDKYSPDRQMIFFRMQVVFFHTVVMHDADDDADTHSTTLAHIMLPHVSDVALSFTCADIALVERRVAHKRIICAPVCKLKLDAKTHSSSLPQKTPLPRLLPVCLMRAILASKLRPAVNVAGAANNCASGYQFSIKVMRAQEFYQFFLVLQSLQNELLPPHWQRLCSVSSKF
jgi:hypothetical protein